MSEELEKHFFNNLQTDVQIQPAIIYEGHQVVSNLLVQYLLLDYAVDSGKIRICWGPAEPLR